MPADRQYTAEDFARWHDIVEGTNFACAFSVNPEHPSAAAQQNGAHCKAACLAALLMAERAMTPGVIGNAMLIVHTQQIKDEIERDIRYALTKTD